MDKRLILLIIFIFTMGARPVNVRCPIGSNTDGLVALWQLDHDESPTRDSSGNGHNATQAGNPVNAAGYFGNCEVLDGTGDHFEAADSTAFDSDLTEVTFAMWILSDIEADGRGICGKYVAVGDRSFDVTSWLSGADKGAMIRIFDSDGDYMDITPKNNGDWGLMDGNWHFLVFTWDGGLDPANLHIYIDGVEMSANETEGGTFSGTVDDCTDGFQIGNNPTRADWDGKLDCFAVFDRALSLIEIKNIYYRQVGTY
jgi:hypothetical protein